MIKELNYSSLQLIEDLKEEVSRICPYKLKINNITVKMFYNGKLPYSKLSLLLCDYKNRIKRILRNIRSNPNFKIAQDELLNWEKRIKYFFDLKCKNALSYIKKYKKINRDLPHSRKKGLKVLNFHPNLKLEFFEEINTKEKAYWLGFLWAEVYLGKRGGIRLELNKKDEILIDRFCKALGLNLNFKKYRNKSYSNKIHTYVRISFKNEKIQNDLYQLGYIKSSEKSTKFPKLKNKSLDLAFLLGFFDGDGKQGTNTFHIGSKEILQDIKKKFDVPHKIILDGNGNYYLNLGGKLFNEMMKNFKKSLSRKRRLFRIPTKDRLKELITRAELKKMVWKKPLKEIAKEYDSYPRAIAEICDELDIKRPPERYWLSKRG